jgi:hypothetical protein
VKKAELTELRSCEIEDVERRGAYLGDLERGGVKAGR